MNHIMAGVGRADMTPPVGIAHVNWGARTHDRAEGIDLPLYATVLLLEQDGLRAAIVDQPLAQVLARSVKGFVECAGKQQIGVGLVVFEQPGFKLTIGLRTTALVDHHRVGGLEPDRACRLSERCRLAIGDDGHRRLLRSPTTRLLAK